MTLFIFTSSRDVLRAAWAKWHGTAEGAAQEAEAHAGGRQSSPRLSAVLRAVTIRDEAATLSGRN